VRRLGISVQMEITGRMRIRRGAPSADAFVEPECVVLQNHLVRVVAFGREWPAEALLAVPTVLHP